MSKYGILFIILEVLGSMKNAAIFLLLFGFLSMLGEDVYAQDYKFNQFYNSPLNLNPAMTGKIKGLYRLVANYRVQSSPISTPAPYSTISASGDVGLMRDKLKGDILGVGLVVSSDLQAGGALKTTDLMASIAYHKSFGYNNEHYLSAGFQFGLKNRRLDISQLYFESQFNSDLNQFDLSLPNLETFDNSSFNAMNLNAGIFWSSNFTKTVSAYAGASMFNLMQPRDNFFYANNERALRFHGHGGAVIQLKNKFLLNPNGYFVYQQKAQDWVAGTSFTYGFSGKNAPFEKNIFVGVWYEGSGAVIGSAGVQLKGIQFTFSYDRTISELSNANNGFGAFEASIIYQSSPLSSDKKYPIMNCPRF